MSEERWKKIRNFPEYEISDKGKVKSNKGHYLHILKPIKVKSGYFCVDLQRKIHFIHILVLEAFVGPRPEGLVGNHKDGVKINNNIENLEWITHTEDMKHAFRLGLSKSPWQNSGEKSPASKLKDSEVWLIKRLLWFEYPQKKIAEMFKITRSAVTLINRGITWQQIKFELTEEDRSVYRKLFNMQETKI